MKILMLLGFLIALMACSSLVPAKVPPQLAATAGMSILITDEIVDAGWFTVNYPDGWRVVKLSIAGEALHLSFVAPNTNSTWIELSESGFLIPDITLDPNLYERLDRVTYRGKTVYLWGRSPIEEREAFDVIFQQVMESIEFR
jgi:hypothetical protein